MLAFDNHDWQVGEVTEIDEPTPVRHADELRAQIAVVQALRDELEQGPLSERSGWLHAQLEEEAVRLAAMRASLRRPGPRKVLSARR